MSGTSPFGWGPHRDTPLPLGADALLPELLSLRPAAWACHSGTCGRGQSGVFIRILSWGDSPSTPADSFPSVGSDVFVTAVDSL